MIGAISPAEHCKAGKGGLTSYPLVEHTACQPTELKKADWRRHDILPSRVLRAKLAT